MGLLLGFHRWGNRRTLRHREGPQSLAARLVQTLGSGDGRVDRSSATVLLLVTMGWKRRLLKKDLPAVVVAAVAARAVCKQPRRLAGSTTAKPFRGAGRGPLSRAMQDGKIRWTTPVTTPPNHFVFR